MVADVEVTIDHDEPTGAAVNFVEHAVGKGLGDRESWLVNFTARSAMIALTRFALQQQQGMCRMTCASAL